MLPVISLSPGRPRPDPMEKTSLIGGEWRNVSNRRLSARHEVDPDPEDHVSTDCVL